jgi:hypothetical protein
MKKLILPFFCVVLCLSLSGCGLMEDAFKAGFIIALILAAIIGLLIWVLHMSWKVMTKYFPAICVHFEGFWDE